MLATRITNAVAAILAGAVLTAAGSATAHADSPQSSTPTPSSQLKVEFWGIQNFKSGKYLQAVSSANGARVVQQPRDSGVLLQNWFLVLDGSYTTFENYQSGLNLGIDGASTSSGAAAITANGSSDLNQDWIQDDDAYIGAYVALKNRKSGLCLGISGASTANGAQAAQFPCDGSSNQSWLLTH